MSEPVSYTHLDVYKRQAYRDAIEKDGLATWILIDDWESPAEIRALLKELYEDRRCLLYTSRCV